MSIGVVLRYTYEETCEVCDKIAHYAKVVGKNMNKFFVSVSYARNEYLNLQDRDTTKKSKH